MLMTDKLKETRVLRRHNFTTGSKEFCWKNVKWRPKQKWLHLYIPVIRECGIFFFHFYYTKKLGLVVTGVCDEQPSLLGRWGSNLTIAWSFHQNSCFCCKNRRVCCVFLPIVCRATRKRIQSEQKVREPAMMVELYRLVNSAAVIPAADYIPESPSSPYVVRVDGSRRLPLFLSSGLRITGSLHSLALFAFIGNRCLYNLYWGAVCRLPSCHWHCKFVFI